MEIACIPGSLGFPPRCPYKEYNRPRRQPTRDRRSPLLSLEIQISPNKDCEVQGVPTTQ